MRAVLDVSDAAYYLHTTDAAVRELVNRHLIPYRKYGDELIFLIKDLDLWIQATTPQLRNSLFALPKARLPKEDIDESIAVEDDVTPDNSPTIRPGYVYILQYGRHYKIGQSSVLPRRIRNLETQFPEPCEVVHFLKAAEPLSAEAGLQYVFREQRGLGEWFSLSDDDLARLKTLTTLTVRDASDANRTLDYASGSVPRVKGAHSRRPRRNWENLPSEDRPRSHVYPR